MKPNKLTKGKVKECEHEWKLFREKKNFAEFYCTKCLKVIEKEYSSTEGRFIDILF